MHACAHLHISTPIYRYHRYCFVKTLHSRGFTLPSSVMHAAVKSKLQNVTHFMHEVYCKFSLLRVKRPRKMICQLPLKKIQKSFFNSQNYWTDSAVIKKDRATKHMLGLYQFTPWLSLSPCLLGRFCMKGQSLAWFLYSFTSICLVTSMINSEVKKV